MDSTENKPTGEVNDLVPEQTGERKSSLEPVNDATGTYNYYDDYGYDHPPHEEGTALVVAQASLLVLVRLCTAGCPSAGSGP